MKKGKYIVFEGIDGSGKSTLMKRLARQLTEEGESFYQTFEPTDSFIGKTIRKILAGKIQSDEKTIAALYLADRLHHIQNEDNGMLGFLNQGVHVLSDRYYLSSYAYHVPHVSLDWVIDANSVCAELLRPDLILFIDISVEESLRRLSKGRKTLDRFETKGRLTQVRNNYFTAIDRMKYMENIKIIDGELAPAQVFKAAYEEIANVLEKSAI